MKDENSKGNPYLMAFIVSKGGAKKVQHEVDLGYQAIVQLEKGMRFGSPESFRKFYEAYPDEFDIIQASTGMASKGQASEANVSPIAGKGEDVGPGGKLWKDIAEEYRLKYENLLVRFLENEHPELFTDKEGVKIQSSDRTTVEALLFSPVHTQVYGLVRYEEPGDQPIEDFLDKTLES